MKILIDARMYGLEHAGIGRYLINLTDQISKLDSKNKYILILRKKYFNRLKCPNNWKKVLFDFRHYSFLEQTKLPGIISKEKPNIVHFPHFNIPIFYKGKFVVTIHDLTMHRQGRDATTLPLPLYYAKRIPYKLIFKNAVNKSTKVIVPTKFVKRDLVDYYEIDEDKIKVIYEGLENRSGDLDYKFSEIGLLRRYKLIPNKYFIYVGNVYPHKNLNRTIEAIVLLNRSHKDKVTLAIASSRSVFTKRLEESIRGFGAEKLVKLLGFVPDEELVVLLKNSTAFIYPSLSEGFGLQGLESMAAGTLVIASDIPVFKEVYKDNVFYFNPFDFSSIARTMEEVLKIDTKEREKIIKKGQKFIKRYSWSKMAKQTLRVYKEAVKTT